MSISVTYDLAEGFRFTSGAQQSNWNRPFLATGIAEDTPSNMLVELFAALPTPGDSAPPPWNLRVMGRTVSKLWKNSAGAISARGVVRYSWGSPATRTAPSGNDDDGTSLTITSFTEDVEITENSDGSPITVEDSDTLVRGETVTVSKSRARIVFTRRELDFPLDRIREYTNAINAGPWEGFADSTVRLESINVDTANDGINYIVAYTFIYKPERWNAIRIVGQDLQTGKPIAHPTGAQVTLVDPYLRRSFSPLRIDLPT